MIPPVSEALITFMVNNTTPAITAWEAEFPRYDAGGVPISPQPPSNWPAVMVSIDEPGFARTPNLLTDPFSDKGTVTISVYGTDKVSVYNLMDKIDNLWAKVSNWINTVFSPTGDPSNGFYIIHMQLGRWWLGQEKDERVGGSLLLYRGDLVYDPCEIHGAVSTQ